MLVSGRVVFPFFASGCFFSAEGRVGTITHEEKHPGSFEMVHVKELWFRMVTLGEGPAALAEKQNLVMYTASKN